MLVRIPEHATKNLLHFFACFFSPWSIFFSASMLTIVPRINNELSDKLLDGVCLMSRIVMNVLVPLSSYYSALFLLDCQLWSLVENNSLLQTWIVLSVCFFSMLKFGITFTYEEALSCFIQGSMTESVLAEIDTENIFKPINN